MAPSAAFRSSVEPHNLSRARSRVKGEAERRRPIELGSSGDLFYVRAAVRGCAVPRSKPSNRARPTSAGTDPEEGNDRRRRPGRAGARLFHGSLRPSSCFRRDRPVALTAPAPVARPAPDRDRRFDAPVQPQWGQTVPGIPAFTCGANGGVASRLPTCAPPSSHVETQAGGAPAPTDRRPTCRGCRPAGSLH